MKSLALATVETFRNQVLHCDAETLLRSLPAESVDLIFTDPPYQRKYLHLYRVLAVGAARVLKPGGFLLAMAGGSYTADIMSLMASYLTFYWTLNVYLSTGGRVYPQGLMMPLITHVKPIHAFMKGRGTPRTVVHDVELGGGNDKRFHHWGQDMKSARYFIDCFSRPGDLVVDPFCGGGTYPVVCVTLERNYIGCDIDFSAVETSRARLRNHLFVPQENGQLSLAFSK